MNPLAQAGLEISTGETVLFWVLAPIAVLCALSLLFTRRPVRIAVAMIAVLVSLAVFYIANEAPFLGVAQIVVYRRDVVVLAVREIVLGRGGVRTARRTPLPAARGR